MKKLFVVGTGPGEKKYFTQEALCALEESQVIAGYKVYVDLVKKIFPNKVFYSNGMTGELDRCFFALSQAALGKTVSLVCSGDSGIYAMASLILELAGKEYKPRDFEVADSNTKSDSALRNSADFAKSGDFSGVEIEIVCGVTAAIAGSAILGSPLTNDFAVISLSDRLTSPAQIEKRLRAAASGDFCVALYNPRSSLRPRALKNACRILLETLSPETICGFVKNIGRGATERKIETLSELENEEVDMFTTVFIGNSATKLIKKNGELFMVTTRGYENRGNFLAENRLQSEREK